MHDVLIVGIELTVPTQLDQLLEVTDEGHLAARRLRRLLDRSRKREEFAYIALDVQGIGKDELDLEVQDLLELFRPSAHEGLAGCDGQFAAADRDGQNAVALGISVGHRARDRDQIDLQRIDVVIGNAELAGQPFDQPLQRHERAWRQQRAPFLIGDHLQRMLEAMRA